MPNLARADASEPPRSAGKITRPVRIIVVLLLTLLSCDPEPPDQRELTDASLSVTRLGRTTCRLRIDNPNDDRVGVVVHLDVLDGSGTGASADTRRLYIPGLNRGYLTVSTGGCEADPDCANCVRASVEDTYFFGR